MQRGIPTPHNGPWRRECSRLHPFILRRQGAPSPTWGLAGLAGGGGELNCLLPGALDGGRSTALARAARASLRVAKRELSEARAAKQASEAQVMKARHGVTECESDKVRFPLASGGGLVLPPSLVRLPTSLLGCGIEIRFTNGPSAGRSATQY